MKKNNESFNNIVNEKMNVATLSSIGLACNLVSEKFNNLPLLKNYPINEIDLYYLRAQITQLFEKFGNEEKVNFNIVTRDSQIIKKIAHIVVYDYFRNGDNSMIVKSYKKWAKDSNCKYSGKDTYKPIELLIKLI